MLESLAAWVLKHFLGKYVENLNTDQLTIGLLQGEVELENLPLKKEALRQVGLPIQVTAGFIGKVKLQIPFRALRTAPWAILIEKLYIVAAPVNLNEWDEEADGQALLDQKLSILEALEAQWRASREGLDQGYYASSYLSWMNFGTSVITNIVENLQNVVPVVWKTAVNSWDPESSLTTIELNITDVHIRYEDPLTIENKFFTFGLVIDSLVAQTCNEDWEVGFSSGQHSYKVVQLTNLSIYWDDCRDEDILANKSAADFIESMGNHSCTGRQYILNHVSGKANLQKNLSLDPLRSRSTPRVVCDVMFDDFPITLTEVQYSQLVYWIKGMELLKCRIMNKRFRPCCTISSDPRKWWHYIVQATIHRNAVASTWDVTLKRFPDLRSHHNVFAAVDEVKARDNVAYVKIYEKILLDPDVTLSDEETVMKDGFEYEHSLEQLRALRIAAMYRIRPSSKAATASTGSYLSSWLFWYSTSAATGDSVEEKRLNDEIIKALENPMDDATYLKRDVVFGQFNFCLKQGTINLSGVSEDNTLKPLMQLQLEKVVLGFESRPRSASYKLSVMLGAMFLKDHLTADTVFPVLVAPQGREQAPSSIDMTRNLPPSLAKLINLNSASRTSEESLFQLSYEIKPFNSNADCRLHVKTRSLDIVYNPDAFSWLADFFTKPQQAFGSNLRLAARRKYQALKTATTNELKKNWEKIIAGDLSNRKTWDVDLDISAPQIILVEHFCDKNAIIVVVDLGRLHFSNCNESVHSSGIRRDSDDEEAFETPCSTPPGSKSSPEGARSTASQLSQQNLHQLLYDRYAVELSDLQVLVGRVRENWKYAQLKGTSTLHVLDRFNISMQIERRVVYTADPLFPSLTFIGNLPRLVVHVNEQKISSLRTICAIVMGSNVPSPFRGSDPVTPEDDLKADLEMEPSRQDDIQVEASRLVILQFTVHHMALEVQSRNKSVAELQVSGVRATCTRRPYDTSVTLTVHSLLLVDAMQTFGRDFELLVASHKHVGMDSLSGSIRDSEPCSPTSPGSPEPGEKLASPVALSQALTSLENRALSPQQMYNGTSMFGYSSPPCATSPSAHPPLIRASSLEAPDVEALITVELTFISGSCPGHDGLPLQIAAVQFNNLDVIANQETIVELVGFVRRVFPASKPTVSLPNVEADKNQPRGSVELPSEDATVTGQVPTKIEATFDFHRLNILLLRAVIKDGVSVGRKICTATMTQAKIKATVGSDLVVEGSLGGIQVLDLTPEGQRHQRILSVGADPLVPPDSFSDMSARLYNLNPSAVPNNSTAFSFSVRRSLDIFREGPVDVIVRLASVWYTHSPNLIKELQSCAAEFQQYISNLARSIRTAATEVAMGLVHARAEALAFSLSVSNRISSSLYGGSNPDVSSPRKRRRSFTQSLDNMGGSHTPFTPFTPHSPEEETTISPIKVNLDCVLDTPVIVLPRASTSDDVFVAHLGKITLRNSYPEYEMPWTSRVERYHIDVRDMNLYSILAGQSITNQTIPSSGDPTLHRPEKVYSCTDGKAILHDTAIEITIERSVNTTCNGSMDFDSDCFQQIQLSGSVVGPLKISLSRGQYKKVLETSQYLLSTLSPVEVNLPQARKKLVNIQEENTDTTDSTFRFEEKFRPRPMLTSAAVKEPKVADTSISLSVEFDLPEFTVELLGEGGVPQNGPLVSISFRDFSLRLDRPSSKASHLQMTLKSLLMQDLLVSENDKNRFLVVSSAISSASNRHIALSKSCPNLSNCPTLLPEHSSLPDDLATKMYGGKTSGRRSDPRSKVFSVQTVTKLVPNTPPPSPTPGRGPRTVLDREENLVLISIDMIDRSPTHGTQFNKIDRNISVDFNCLDIIGNSESWVVVLDFFASDDTDIDENKREAKLEETSHNVRAEEQFADVTSKMDLQIKSLTLVLVRPEYEVAKANISNLFINTVSSSNYSLEGRLGSMSLADLTPHGKIYRERFLTTGKEALHLQYIRHGVRSPERENRPCDSELRIEMSSVVYIHTQRFLNEIYSYFYRFSQHQNLMAAMRTDDFEKHQLKPSSRLLISINAGSPVLILPVASTCTDVLVADLGELTVRNGFRKAGSEGTIATSAPEGTTTVSCLLDVMTIDLVNMELFTGCRVLNSGEADCLFFGNVRIRKAGPSLLPDKCHLKLQVDRNLDAHLSREVPDLSVQGTLTKLEGFLDLAQYKLIRGLLAYNIGENLQDLTYFGPDLTNSNIPAQMDRNTAVWLTLSIHLDLVNVVLHLRDKHNEGSSLACINFIRSRLVVETFSDRSQDIDLVSAEILLTDTRYLGEPMNKRCNVFTNILQPLGYKSRPGSSSSYKSLGDRGKMEKKGSQDSDDGCIQAEIHHRRRKDYSKATVLLHNMRVMAILDWWETVRDFIAENFELPASSESQEESSQANSRPSSLKTAYHPSLRTADKYPAVIDIDSPPFEFKLNVTDSEIVLVEDTSVWDTNAIILKSTTVISYRPTLLEKPLSCNLNHCEVFSCVLGMEDETALSIIDPVTINMEVALRAPLLVTRGISDAMVTSQDRLLEVSMQTLNVRLSYNDFKMLAQMLESVPKQTRQARDNANQQVTQPANVRNQINKLTALGFSAKECSQALELSNGKLDEAAIWLTQNAVHDVDIPAPPDTSSSVSFDNIEVKVGCLSIVVIDDCRDADVPLLEISLSQLCLKPSFDGEGFAKFLLTSDYYNRVLSGWEPFIEPWRCNFKWQRSIALGLSRNRLQLDVSSDEILTANLTSTFMELYSTVKANWTEDYYGANLNRLTSEEKNTGNFIPRRRLPFVPFALKNDTGCPLWFNTIVTTAEMISEQQISEKDDGWLLVEPNETIPFSFEGREKKRHRDTHKVRVHQISVRVGVWSTLKPVSVDKVGVFFRQAPPQSELGQLEVKPARVVFAVTLEGSARKLITVRSALTVRNHLNEAVEVKLENTDTYQGVWDETICLQIAKNSTLSVPLSHAHSHIWVRPIDSANKQRYHAFSSSPIGWMNVTKAGETIHEAHQCHTNRDKSYRFVAGICHENLPESSLRGVWLQPAHTISLYSPVLISNLLPCDLQYSVRQASVRGYIKPGTSASIHEVDCDQQIVINLQIEGFTHGILTLPTPAAGFKGDVRLSDEVGRRLILDVVVDLLQGAGVCVSVSAPYWIVNKTSIPMVIRQEGSSQDAAGQAEETEVARVVTPLLFSLADHDAAPMAQLRVGKKHLHDSTPQWCQPFPLHAGTAVLRLRVSHREPNDVVYAIGINVRSGKGRHRRTKIITLTPRFQLHNKSSFELQFAQHCLASTLNDPSASATYSKAVKDCSLAWHWPRVEKKHLLCVRLVDVKQCLWSGRFPIDNDDSFHVNIRDIHGKMHFLRAEIVLQGATYFTVFTDADNMPPPVRIDNLSQVSVEFYQSDPKTETPRSTVRPQSSVPYAWDLPHAATKLTVIAPGGSSASYEVNDASSKSTVTLTYENFIYIALTTTFNHVDEERGPVMLDAFDLEGQQLVLDCTDGAKVVLNRKQQGARSQLWRMTSEGQLQHEGSSPPRDPKSKSSRSSERTLVLDIASTAPQPTQCAPLMLRRPDPRRSSTQTWRFTEDGRLCCAHNNMCVQAKDGFFGIRQGSEAVLGPKTNASVRGSYEVPPEQAVSRMKMRPGSGYLSVSVNSDGPTRVLSISDPIDVKGNEKEWAVRSQQDEPTAGPGELQINVKLANGLGVSVVSRQPPEELLFIHLKGIFLSVGRTAAHTTFDCTIEDIQCDNQLFEPQFPTVLYVARSNKEEEPRKQFPAIIISAHKQHSNNSNAHIFKHLIVTVKNLSVGVEELLLLKLFAMFGSLSEVETEDAEESDFETQRRIMEATSVNATRYYFGILKLSPGEIRLSVATSQKLPHQLKRIKRKLGLSLIQFEDAVVALKELRRRHAFETSQCLISSVIQHFKKELAWHAPYILVAVDFLGNPAGLLNDVSEGVTGLFTDGNVGTLVKSVTHGLSNSAAKFTESISDGIGRALLDDSHEETRQRIRKAHSGSSSDHLWAGVKGLGFGVLGGMTSVFKQTYEGAVNEGVPGIFTGFTKGLVGAVTKPMIGVLDFASETASAVRDSSRSSDRPKRYRLTRIVLGPGGLMPPFSAKQAEGQEFLYNLNERDYSERLIAYEVLQNESEDVGYRIIISTENVVLFTPTAAVVAHYHLSTLRQCLPVSVDDPAAKRLVHYIELIVQPTVESGLPTQDAPKKRPRVRCESRELAERVAKQINYAQNLFEETRYTVTSTQDLAHSS